MDDRLIKSVNDLFKVASELESMTSQNGKYSSSCPFTLDKVLFDLSHQIIVAATIMSASQHESDDSELNLFLDNENIKKYQSK